GQESHGAEPNPSASARWPAGYGRPLSLIGALKSWWSARWPAGCGRVLHRRVRVSAARGRSVQARAVTRRAGAALLGPWDPRRRRAAFVRCLGRCAVRRTHGADRPRRRLRQPPDRAAVLPGGGMTTAGQDATLESAARDGARPRIDVVSA